MHTLSFGVKNVATMVVLFVHFVNTKLADSRCDLLSSGCIDFGGQAFF